MSAQPRTQETGTAELPTLFDERYVLEQRLGGGGMGVVYRARDLIAEKRHDRHPYVAIKLISEALRNSEQARTLLQRECSRAQRLSHPNIVRVYYYDCEERTDCDYLIMELLAGESLERVIHGYPSGMEWNRAASVIRQLCDGLQYAHAEGIVHSDIKPSNLFMTDAGVLKILDFGIAAPLRSADTATSETLLNPRRLGAVAPRYSSLEMFLGKDADPSDDVYSAACVIYELLTGQHPYQGMETPRAAELTLVPALIPALNRSQNRALRKALNFRRIDRTATIAELKRGLLEQGSRLPALPARYMVGGSAAALLAIAAVVLWRMPPTTATKTPITVTKTPTTATKTPITATKTPTTADKTPTTTSTAPAEPIKTTSAPETVSPSLQPVTAAPPPESTIVTLHDQPVKPTAAPSVSDIATPLQRKQQPARHADGPPARKAEDHRCASLSEQVQLGEILNEEQRTYLKQHCQ